MLAPERLTSTWDAGPVNPSLGPGDVHLWCAALDVEEGAAGYLEGLLDESERTRAARFRVPRHRDRWIASRAILRSLLSRYARVPAAELRFFSEPNGKPHLLDARGSDVVHFNLAHADDVALIAVSSAGALGVDVERVQPMPDAVLIAETHFAPGERERLRRLAPSEVDAGFFRCWTRKEAFIKAVGGGLSIPLDSFEVSLEPESTRILHLDGDHTAAADWSLMTCAPAPGFLGAVAIRRPGLVLARWRWE